MDAMVSLDYVHVLICPSGIWMFGANNTPKSFMY